MRRAVLSEDEYLACLSVILRRDYFPALASEEDAALRQRHDLDVLSVDCFQANYTCADDDSFERMMARVNAKRREKWVRFFGTDQPLLTRPRRDLLPPPSSAADNGATINREAVRRLPYCSSDSTAPAVPQDDCSMLRTPLLVPGTPSSSARGEGAYAGTPLMTWGRLLSTPQRIDGNASPRRATPSAAMLHIIKNAHAERSGAAESDLRGIFRTPRRK